MLLLKANLAVLNKPLVFLSVSLKERTFVEASEEVEGVTHFETSALGKSQCVQFQKLPIQWMHFSLPLKVAISLTENPHGLRMVFY